MGKARVPAGNVFRRAISRSVGVLLAVAMGIVVSLALGQSVDATPVKVEIKAHEGCPNASDFVDEMTARSKKVRAAKSDKGKDEKGTKVFKVTIKKVGKESVGEIVIPTGPFATKKETLKHADCEELVGKLAYLAAKSIDADALETPPEPSASVTASATETATAPPTVSASATAPPEPPSEGRFRIAIGAGVQVEALSAPGVLIATPFYAEVTRTSSGLVSPSIRVGFVREKGGVVETAVGNGVFKWVYLQLDGCPVHVGLGTKLWLRPCVGVQVGQVEGVGGQIASSRTEPRPWFSARLLGRLVFTPIDNFFVDVGVGLALPITRDAFVFERGTTIYKAPVVAPFGGLDIGVRF